MIYYITAALLALLISQSIALHTLRRTIDKLTDKLMAKDYNEYKRHEQKVMTEEAPKRKPMSYYDDDSVDTDEVK